LIFVNVVVDVVRAVMFWCFYLLIFTSFKF